MRILALLILSTILTGCVGGAGGGGDATLSRLDAPMTALAGALAGEDVAAMRHAGRVVIAIYDAGRDPK